MQRLRVLWMKRLCPKVLDDKTPVVSCRFTSTDARGTRTNRLEQPDSNRQLTRLKTLSQPPRDPHSLDFQPPGVVRVGLETRCAHRETIPAS